MNPHYALLMLLVTLSGTPVSVQELTLRERAALAHDELNVGVGAEGPSPTIDELTREADLIVVGALQPRGSYLSADGMAIYSDYAVSVQEVLFGALGTLPRPGVQPEIIVTHLGGDLVLDGKRIRMHDMRLPELPVGSRVILLLKRSDGGKYTIVRDSFGAFQVQDAHVKALVERLGRHHEMDGSSEASFVAHIRAVRGGRE